MPNPLFGGTSPLKNAMDMMRNAANPQAVLQQVAQKDPQIAQIMQLVQGRNPQEVFYAMCQQRGIDPESVLNQLR